MSLQSKRRSSAPAPRHAFRLRACAAALAAAGLLATAVPEAARAQALPVWRAGQANPTGGNIANSGFASITSQTERALNIKQTSDRAIINWYTFNIARGNSVTFEQNSATSAVLNRVGRGVDASRIAGSLNANGQVYLINPNGVVFENGAQVNVGGLIASTLDIRDDVFLNGLLDPASMQDAQFVFDGTTEAELAAAAVRVEQGAKLAAARGGRLFLFGTSVENAGELSAPEGQVALAGGGKVYLLEPTDSRLRNVLVEVDPTVVTDGAGGSREVHGSVANTATGSISTPRGNVTMVSYAVNQAGRLSATNAVDLDGSIILSARDSAQNTSVDSSGNLIRIGEVGGTLTLGANSVTEVRPDTDANGAYSSTETTETPIAARIALSGRDIDIGTNAQVVATAGKIEILARSATGSHASNGTVYPSPSVQVAAGATLDVSGLKDVTRAMSDNELEVELRGYELADSPMQRDGILRTRGQEKFYFDLRQLDADGKVALANLSGYRDQRGLRIDEASTQGGTISIDSGNGAVAFARGSVVDVSGGKTTVQAGTMRRTYVRDASGREYDIDVAPADRTYVSYRVVKVREAGYVRGASAGALSIESGSGAVDLGASLRGGVTIGQYQRASGGIGDAARPIGASLSLNTLKSVVLGSAGELQDLAAGNVGLDASMLSAGGFASLVVNTNRYGDITLTRGAELELADSGSVQLDGRRVDLYGRLAAAGAKVVVSASKDTEATRGDYGVSLHTGAEIDVAGNWTNDDLAGAKSAAPTAIVLNGGSVALTAAGGDVRIEEGASIDVSGGARLVGGKLKAGNAGSIALTAGKRFLSGDIYRTVAGTVSVAGSLRGEALADNAYRASAKGGSLTISASDLRVSAAATGLTADGETTLLGADMFANGGFQDFSLTGLNGLTVASGTTIAPTPTERLLARGYQRAATGSDLASMTQSVRVADDQRAASSVSLIAGMKVGSVGVGPAVLAIEEGATVSVNPGGSISAYSARQLDLNGTLIARGGEVALSGGNYEDKGLSGEEVYDPARSLHVGATALIDVSGVAVYDPNPVAGRLTGKVLDGGSLALDAGEGWLLVDAGAQLLARGTSATLDVGQAGQTQQRQTVATRGGDMAFTSRYGMWIDGTLDARAGSADMANGSLRVEQQEGVHIKPMQSSSTDNWLVTPATVVLTQTQADHAGSTPTLDDDLGLARISAQTITQGGFDNVALVSGAGVNVAAAHAIRFDGDVALNVRGTLQLDAPNLVSNGGTQTLRAATVQIGDLSNQRGRAVDVGTDAPAEGSAPAQLNAALAEAAGGSGRLDVQGNAIDLVGDVHTQGYAALDFSAAGDIQLRGAVGTQDSGERRDNKPIAAPLYAGSLVTAGDVTMRARTVYPVTGAQYQITIDGALAPDGTVRFAGNGAPGGIAQSALGSLTVSAPNIVQGGDLQAPFGSIALIAGNSLVLDAGSRTSVSADGASLLYGETRLSGREWYYDYAKAGTTSGLENRLALDALPASEITLSGAKVDLRNGATVDLSGGGELLANEFIAGSGGTSDLFSNPDVYAIVPTQSGAQAAYDYRSGTDANLGVGAQVQLYDGVAGLAAGTYTLLPARYALTDPNAVLVTVKSDASSFKSTDFSAAQTRKLDDGSYLVAGRRVTTGADGQTIALDARTVALQVASVDWAQARSEVLQTKASQFFADSGRSTADAGRLGISARETLGLGATLTAAAQADGARALVDISADALRITTGTDADTAPAGTVSIAAADLAAFDAGSLLLGGERRVLADGTQVVITAANTVSLDAGVQLSGAEITLAARDTITLGAGARLSATTAGTDTASARPMSTTGDGALLRVSAADLPEFTRAGVQIDAATGVAATGSIDIAQGATVAGRSVILDATRATSNAGTVALADGGGLAIGAPRITAGGVEGTVPGMVLTPELLASAANAGELRFKSYTTFDLAGGAVLGGADTRTLSIEAGAIRGLDNANTQARLQAKTVRIANPDGSAGVTQSAADGSALTIVADTLELGRGEARIVGFASTTLAAAERVQAVADGRLDADGNLIVQSPRTGVAAGADYTLAATGDVVFAQAAKAADANEAAGGVLSVHAGGRLDVAATIVARSGTLALSGDQGVLLRDGARVDASGYAQSFADKTVAAQAGSITIASATGDVALDAGSLVTVAGTAGGAAGSVNLSAVQGRLVIDGTLDGHAAQAAGQTAPPTQGSLSLDADTLPGFAAIAAANAGGFTEALSLRQRAGDLRIDHDLEAHTFSAAADQGGIEVSATIDASEQTGGSARGGSIALYANGDASATASGDANGLAGRVRLTDAARLLAVTSTSSEDGVGDTGRAGTVLVSSMGAGADKIVIADGARIDVGVPEGSAQSGGSITLRAPRTADGTQVQIAAIGDADAVFTTGAGGQVIVDAVKTYQGSLVKQTANNGSAAADPDGAIYLTGANSIDADNQVLAAHVAAIDAALFGGARVAHTIRPEAEIVSGEDLTIASSSFLRAGTQRTLDALDLSTLRYQGNADASSSVSGVLTLRAAGNVNAVASISDGYVAPVGAVATRLDLSPHSADTLKTSGDAWSYRIAAGAAIDAADPLATHAERQGDLVLGDGAFIRTGAGSIDVAAAGDVRFGRAVEVVKAVGVGTEARNSAIYTGGVASATELSAADFPMNATAILAGGRRYDFGNHGGDVRITAGGSVAPAEGAETSVYYGDWFWRQGNYDTGLPSSATANNYLAWWGTPAYFQQGVATFGGGDVLVNAGGAVSKVTLAAVSNARQGVTTDAETGERSAGAGAFVQHGGGSVVVNAGGAISATTMLANAGDIRLRSASLDTAPVFAIGNGAVDVQTRGDAEIGSVFNATLAQQSAINAANGRSSYFSTYGDQSALRVVSTGGDVTLDNAAYSRTEDLHVMALSRVLPGTVQVAALSGDLTIAEGMTLYPSAQGQLDLLAAGSVALNGPIVQSDVDPATLPTRGNPTVAVDSITASPSMLALLGLGGASQIFGAAAHTNAEHALHDTTGAEDTDPSRIVALHGAISATQGSYVALAESATVEASGDLTNFRLIAQNLRASDVTRVTAGGSLIYTTIGDEIRSNTTTAGGRTVIDAQNVGIQVGGPGDLVVTAGGDIRLGDSVGIVTRGNLDNPYLPSGGANALVLAGSGPLDVGTFAHYLDSADQTLVRNAIGYDKLLADYLKSLGLAEDATLDQLTTAQRDNFYLQVFGAIASSFGAEATSSGHKGSYYVIYEAFAALFPESVNGRRYAELVDTSGMKLSGSAGKLAVSGDVGGFFDGLKQGTSTGAGSIDLFFSRVSTDQDGRITLLAPDGGINVGLENDPVQLGLAKRPSELGVVARGAGALSMVSAGSIAVNQSRVFTLGGGDILLLSMQRDVDAGRGQKTANATPPADVVVANDFLVKDLGNAISGSGIGALRGRAGVADADVTLLAPIGAVDAGDAGVRSTGRTIVAAETVRNALNISAGGGLSGVVAAAPAAPAATIAPPSSSADAARAADAAGAAPKQNNNGAANSVFTAEIVGTGDTNCDANAGTEECRLRNERDKKRSQGPAGNGGQS